jgi:predicted TIM-barrel fold metal-dependent hydrolase
VVAVVAEEPVVIVSCDTHVGPRLADLRSYCPAAYLDEFDAYCRAREESGNPAVNPVRRQMAKFEHSPETDEWIRRQYRNREIAGHHDVHARLRDMDDDGIAAEVVFHGSQNEEPMPLIPGGTDFFFNPTGEDLEAVAVGQHIYNRWLADFCSVEPDRHAGVAHLPMWDVDRAVAELEWAREAGLRALNFPVPRPGILPYDDPEWEPFWSACEALGMSLNTHAGGGDLSQFNGPYAVCLMQFEIGGWPARRALHRMVFGGVFERHPKLKLVLTEQNGDWWRMTMREYDSSYKTHRWQIVDQVPKPPSEYCRESVFIGASFLASFEAETAAREGYATNVMWGSDYPHAEGTYQVPLHANDPNTTRLSLRHTFSAVAPADIVAMIGDNAVRVFGLDRHELTRVAARIGAPTFAELASPVDVVPAGINSLGFRTLGPWG